MYFTTFKCGNKGQHFEKVDTMQDALQNEKTT